MRRVVVTGLGIVSSLGNNIEEVTTSLRNGNSGITICKEYQEMGFRSHIHGSIKLDPSEFVDRKVLRFMGDGAAYAYIAMQQAIEDSGLEKDQVSNDKTGISEAIKRLKKLSPERIVIESTGRYEAAFITACAKANLPFSMVNPIHVKRFAGAIGRKAKTDKLALKSNQMLE